MLTKPHVSCQVTAVRGAEGVPLTWASAISELREGRLGPALNAQLAASPHARRSLSKRARATRRLAGLERTAPALATPCRTPHHTTVHCFGLQAAFYWETPPTSLASAATTRFAFVTVAAPALARAEPDPGPFAAQLEPCAGAAEARGLANLAPTRARART